MNKKEIAQKALARLKKDKEYYEKERACLISKLKTLNDYHDNEIERKYLEKQIKEVDDVLADVENSIEKFLADE